MTEAIERVARAIASCQGDDFDAMHQDKSEWIETRGHAGGRFRSINEPRKEDYLGMAEAAIAAMPGWQPIETAPKDGATWLLIYDSIHRLTVIARYHDDASAFEGPYGRFVWEMQEDAGALAERSVTHWMPVPPAPEVQS